MGEKETRLNLIDPALRRAGWTILNERHIIEKNKACIETPIYGMPKTSENPTGNGFADYVLFGDDGKPLAVIEAKKSINNEEQGRVQACLYADSLEKQYGVRPVIYYTNGYTIKIIDGLFPARTVFGFHRKDELEYIIQKRGFKLEDKSVSPEICGRYYQKDAIDEVLKHFETKHTRSLIVLATGTGKTRVSCALSDIFIRNNYVKRILFLADRKNLVKQAKEETYEKFLPSVPMSVILEGHREGNESKARIVFSTYQSMLSIIKDVKTCPYGIGHFDLIIVDEAHRSLFNKYAEIFDYFDALMIGLTATPRNDIHKSTYKVFNLDNDAPNYEYDVVKGVKDGYLRYYRALDRTPEILKQGLTYSELSKEEQEQYEDLFTEEDGEIPEKIEGEEFYSVITNKDTIREVLRDLMNEGIKTSNGDVLGKTIIFARDHYHALMIQSTFREMYPELCVPNARNGVDYCVVIDNQIKYNEVLQREFKNNQTIRIVVSVDMMDTGVDIPEVVNLVFFKRVLSKIKFWQMIGRGTRLCDNIRAISPSNAYFERLTNDKTRQLYDSKQGFLIFDICNVFPFFKLNPDGRLDKSDGTLSLYQRVFFAKVKLYYMMGLKYATLDKDDKEYYVHLREEIVGEIAHANRNYIGVIKNLENIEKYSHVEAWLNLTNKELPIIKKTIAPNIQGVIDLDSARAFDYLCYKFAETKFVADREFKKTAKVIFTLSNFLATCKMHVSEVAEHIDTLNYVTSNDFLSNATVVNVDRVREELRDLMRYIDKTDFLPIVSDFDDEIKSNTDADEDEVDFHVTVDDFRTLDEKVQFIIKSNPDEPLVYAVQNLIKPSDEAISAFKKKVVDIATSADEYNALFGDDYDLVVFVRKNVELNPSAVEHFIDRQVAKGYADTQIKYIRELLVFIAQNGKFTREDLLLEELNFNGIFNSEQILSVVSDIETLI